MTPDWQRGIPSSSSPPFRRHEETIVTAVVPRTGNIRKAVPADTPAVASVLAGHCRVDIQGRRVEPDR
jgi:hypothetical protein